MDLRWLTYKEGEGEGEGRGGDRKMTCSPRHFRPYGSRQTAITHSFCSYNKTKLAFLCTHSAPCYRPTGNCHSSRS